MFRNFLALMLCLCLLPAISLAEERAPYEVFTFSASLPERLQEPLSDLIPDESSILSGAAIKYNGYHYGDSPSDLDAYTALVLVDSAEGLRLYAAAWVENLPWQVNDYTRFLRQTEGVSVSIYKPNDYRIPVFSVDYTVQGGIMSDTFRFRNNQIWHIEGHIDQINGVIIDNRWNALEVTDAQGQELFPCNTPFFLDYMADISEFPTNREACESFYRGPAYSIPQAGSIVYASGANLRKESTGKSESLGVYAHNVPMIFTGEQTSGTSYPWYQVQIGNTLGWMSSNYVNCHPDYSYSPIPLGRTLDGCPMYANPGDAQPLQHLDSGATFHILTEYKDMYHICIPQGEISWAVDADGIYGYIPKENVLTSSSPSALDAQSAR